jgi:cytosine/adenosine deaminase-related metal-dependent hydrolase
MLITHGLLVTMTEPNRVIPDGAVYIRDGLIADIGTTQALAHKYAGAHTSTAREPAEIDAQGKLILPGNICAHTHFYGAFARGMAIPDQPAANFVEVLERLWWKLDRALDLEAVRY